MILNKNAVQLLSEVMQSRSWYGDKLERRKANMYKTLLKQGRLSYEKCSEILVLLGYNKVQEESWERSKD